MSSLYDSLFGTNSPKKFSPELKSWLKNNKGNTLAIYNQYMSVQNINTQIKTVRAILKDFTKFFTNNYGETLKCYKNINEEYLNDHHSKSDQINDPLHKIYQVCYSYGETIEQSFMHNGNVLHIKWMQNQADILETHYLEKIQKQANEFMHQIHACYNAYCEKQKAGAGLDRDKKAELVKDYQDKLKIMKKGLLDWNSRFEIDNRTVCDFLEKLHDRIETMLKKGTEAKSKIEVVPLNQESSGQGKTDLNKIVEELIKSKDDVKNNYFRKQIQNSDNQKCIKNDKTILEKSKQNKTDEKNMFYLTTFDTIFGQYKNQIYRMRTNYEKLKIFDDLYSEMTKPGEDYFVDKWEEKKKKKDKEDYMSLESAKRKETGTEFQIFMGCVACMRFG